MRVLITGSKGQLGTELQRIIKDGVAEIGPIPCDYEGAEVVGVDLDELDITNAERVFAFVEDGKFDLVINCAAMTNVDGCETAPEAAYSANAKGPENLAAACSRTGAKLVQVSTDYVFPGNEPGDRVETDKTGPISEYGRTKLEGEHLALAANEKTFVVRTAWLYGYVGKNFVKTMKRLGEKLDQVTVVNDQLGNPTSANDLAYEILKIALTDEYGVYHCTNEGTCSWADFAQRIMEGFRLDCSVARCTSVEYKANNPQSAERPAFSALRNGRLEATVGNEMRPWEVAFASYVNKFDELAD